MFGEPCPVGLLGLMMYSLVRFQFIRLPDSFRNSSGSNYTEDIVTLLNTLKEIYKGAFWLPKKKVF